MAEKSPEEIQQELFEIASAPPVEEPASEEPKPAPEEPPTPAPAPAPVEPPPAAAVEQPVPSWRLREEAEARRLAEQRATLLEARLNEVAALHAQQRKPTDFFENPAQVTEALIAKALQPFAAQQERTAMYLGRMIAETKHGADKVAEAEKSFMDARSAQTLDPADYERVVNSPNRYDAVVQWHRRQSVLASVGEDPNAWFEKQLESRMSDPKFQAQLLEKVRASAAAKPGVTKLPPSLSKATAAAGNSGEDVGDLSDASLFAFAMKGKQR